MSDVTIS